MVTNFEEHTAELSKDELELIPLLVTGFNNYGKDNPIKAPAVVARMNEYLKNTRFNVRMNEARLRKCVNHIRTKAIIPLIATSNGYYVSHDRQEIENQIRSLRERAASIKRCADGLANFIAQGP
jgi:hypothetical protein